MNIGLCIVQIFTWLTLGSIDANRVFTKKLKLINCPSGIAVKDDFIKAGTAATCQCIAVGNGDDESSPKWYDRDGIEVADGSSNLSVKYDPDTDNAYAKYYCKLHQRDPNRVFYSPLFAYGPNSVDLVVDVDDDSGRDPQIYGSCSVEEDDVHPLTADIQVQATLDGKDDVIYSESLDHCLTLRFRFQVRKPAIYVRVTCRAQNTIFPELQIKKEESREIYAGDPPPPHWRVIVKGGEMPLIGNKVLVNSGQNVVVECYLERKYRKLRRINLCCGNYKDSTKELKASVSFQVDTAWDRQHCWCKYDELYQKYMIVFEVQELPTVLQVSANNIQSERLEVKSGERVEFSCKAKGWPQPDLVLKRRHSDIVLKMERARSRRGCYRQHKSTEKPLSVGTVTKFMGCRDTDIYSCKAVNSAGEALGEITQIYVKCPPSLSTRSQDLKAISTGADKALNMTFHIFGYPAPTEYILRRIVNTSATLQKFNLKKVTENYYDVHYKHESSSEGCVTLTLAIGDMGIKESWAFLLTIKNGVGYGLNVTFNETSISVEMNTDDDDDDDSKAGIIGGVLSAILVVAIVVVVAVLFVKKRRVTGPQKSSAQTSSTNIPDSRPPPIRPRPVLTQYDTPREHTDLGNHYAVLGEESMGHSYLDVLPESTSEYQYTDDTYENPFDGQHTK